MNNSNHYPPESAGRIMFVHVPTVAPDATLVDVRELLQRHAAEFASIHYIYVVDAHRKLKGVLSVKQLFTGEPSTQVADVMNSNVISARAHTDQERVALIALKHNIKAVPVTDRDGLLLGVVTADTIMRIIDTESVEDVLRAAGVSGEATGLGAGSVVASVRQRIPWLGVGLLGGILAAGVVKTFESALEAQILLAAFIPTIVYMADAVGTQAQTIFIRYAALEHKLGYSNYLWRELRTSFLLGLLLSGAIWLFAIVATGDSSLGLILCLSLFLTVVCASLIGILLPWLFMRLRLDPAVASGPFATILRDLLSLFIYLSVTNLLL